ncbi:MAG: hypothetical protein OEV49_12315 [candidate division Zixibacteria bacterium]|nr:hypothetical protein [candidate division Zixibacteria bacterium]MDH3935939.1 hypothetical protein [candidate division Zixibacteria bacterium]MDH4034851.1 hypothetical protein [candidate division Zixibacteria bacterium]
MQRWASAGKNLFDSLNSTMLHMEPGSYRPFRVGGSNLCFTAIGVKFTTNWTSHEDESLGELRQIDRET